MNLAGLTAGEWLVLVQHELLLFAGFFFLLGAIDELIVDVVWLWLKVTGRGAVERIEDTDRQERLQGRAAVFIPAWYETQVIATTIRHALAVWEQSALTLYLGCYRNDPDTIAAAIRAVPADLRFRLVVHDQLGPTTKADCLNRLYQAMELDEARMGGRYRMVMLHDAEDMVDPVALQLCDRLIGMVEFVQLPVLPEAQAQSRWIGSHYCEEFAEAHGKSMVVRDALRTGLPSAGVGCAVARAQLARLASDKGEPVPFSADSLTEDYELGLNLGRLGARMRFVRLRHADGRLIATRAHFPDRIDAAVRQKTRWLHGIAFQGWERLGWSRSPAESWMRLRDRRGPLTAAVLAIAYALVVLSFVGWLASLAGLAPAIELTPLLWWLLMLNLLSLVWRACWRFGFTAREYGWREGMRAILRIPVTNVIAIMAGRRAFAAYLRSFAGHGVQWDKTEHDLHPASRLAAGGAQ